MLYRYETHLHTSLSSACSEFEPQQIVEKYTRLGYTGIFVTDHFLNGSTTVPHTLPFNERIELFCRGYEEVKKAAKNRLDVFFGYEYSYLGTDFLVYGMDKEQLVRHPEIMDMSASEFCRFARNEGALIIQAHPYREADYIDHIRLYPSDVDGMEAINACRNERTNRLAAILADEYGLIKTAGSDIHSKRQTLLAGMEFTEKLQSKRDFITRLKCGEGKIFTARDDNTI